LLQLAAENFWMTSFYVSSRCSTTLTYDRWKRVTSGCRGWKM